MCRIAWTSTCRWNWKSSSRTSRDQLRRYLGNCVWWLLWRQWRQRCLLHARIRVFLPPSKEVLFWLRSVCLSVCLSWSEKVVSGFWRNFLEGRAWPRDQGDKFWWRSGSPPGSRSPKSEICIHWIIEESYQRILMKNEKNIYFGDKEFINHWWNFMESWGVV